LGKDTYVFMYSQLFHITIIIPPIFNVQVANLNTILSWFISNVCVTYFYYAKMSQILCSTYNKLSALTCFFIMKLKNILNLLSLCSCQNCFILKLNFETFTFSIYFTFFMNTIRHSKFVQLNFTTHCDSYWLKDSTYISNL
jgi:hypothetical protein